jgi:uncharacterized protein (DUF302 family)
MGCVRTGSCCNENTDLGELGYAPPKLVVYEDKEGRTFVAFDSFTSLLVQYQHEEITQVAQLVEQKLEALVAEVTANGGAS